MENNKTTYKLGQPIQVEVACYADGPQRYNASCAADVSNPLWTETTLEVAPVGPGSKIAVDEVETEWIERALCGYSASLGGSGDYTLYPPVSGEPHWRTVTITTHYPMSAGRFRVRAATEGRTLEMVAGALVPGPEFVARSRAVEFKVVDDPQWRAVLVRQTMHAISKLPSDDDAALDAELEKLRYMPDLKVLEWVVSKFGYYTELAKNHPDRETAARYLRRFLKKYGDVRPSDFQQMVHTILALELASESPALYSRAVKFQEALGDSSRRDSAVLRAWLLPRYRRLMLDIANSMATIHKRDPRSNSDYDLEDEAENLVELSVPECANTHPFLSEDELRRSMRKANLPRKFIAEQINNMRQARIKASVQ